MRYPEILIHYPRLILEEDTLKASKWPDAEKNKLTVFVLIEGVRLDDTHPNYPGELPIATDRAGHFGERGRCAMIFLVSAPRGYCS